VGAGVTAERLQPFRELYEANVDFVWRSLARMGVRDAELEDAVQEVFLVVHRRVHDFEGRAKFTTWLFRICMGIARDRRRRAHNRHEVLVDAQQAEHPDPDQNAATITRRHDDLRLLERGLASMSLDKRAVFVLFELEEFTSEEIAAALELPLGTVYSRLRRARELFRKVLLRSQPGALLREGA
jgi:RNA polymerase sigma-70 factor (ECF subfamily)